MVLQTDTGSQKDFDHDSFGSSESNQNVPPHNSETESSPDTESKQLKINYAIYLIFYDPPSTGIASCVGITGTVK